MDKGVFMDQELLNKVHGVEKEILEKVAAICEKHNIQYYLGDGTLLGAVRHKGFIPWDDDIDVLMPWEDYKRFISIAQEELGDLYFLQTNKTDPNWYRAYATVQKRGTAAIGNKRYHAHQSIWIDIFPLANMSSKIEIQVKKLSLRISNYVLMDHYMKINEEEFRELLTPVGYALCRGFYHIPYKIRYALHEHIVNWVCSGKGRKYTPEIWCSITDVYPYKCFNGKPKKVKFEKRLYDAPNKTKLYLRTNYGPDYMTPVIQPKNMDNMFIDLENDYTKYIE